MKKLITIIVALLATLTINAEEINLGTLEINKEYQMGDYNDYVATYTATKSGYLTCESSNTDEMKPYSDANHTKLCDVTKNGMYGPHSYDLKVVAGTTYYFMGTWMSNVVMKFTFSETQELKLVDSSPATDEEYNVSGSGQVSFNFSKAVAFSNASITIGAQTQSLSGQTTTSSIFFNDVREKIWNALNAKTITPGDLFTITINGVCLVGNKSVLYNGDGKLVAKFKVGKMPITLVSTENTTGEFLSYYTSADPKGIVSLRFSGKIDPSKLGAVLKFGDIDKDAEGDYYVEYLTPTLSDDKQTITINLQGKRRKAQDMVTSGTNYEKMTLGITGVMDENGLYAYAEGAGSLGSYWYAYDFKEVSSNVSCEFTPANGADISSKKSIEMWITDEAKLSYDGILITYDLNGETKEMLITDYKKEADTEVQDAMIITFNIPAEVKTASNVIITLKNLQCADGSDWSNVIRVKYNALVISRISPISGSTLEFLNESQLINIKTNKDAAAEKLNIALRDLSPAEGDNEQLFEGVAGKVGAQFSYTVQSKTRLEVNHDYRLDVTALDAEGKTIGSDYIIYHGAAPVFRYSDTQLSSVTPAPETTQLSKDKDATITLVYDGMVQLKESALYTATPTNPDSEGCANTWTLKVKKETIAQAGATLILPVWAVDSSENQYPVQGNTGYKDNNYQALTYHIDSVAGITTINTDMQKCDVIYNLAGQRVTSPTGIVVLNGKKVIVK